MRFRSPLMLSAVLALATLPPHALAIPGRWMRVADGSALSPAPRMSHTFVLDPARQRAIAFGGYGYSLPFYDLWALSLDRPWTWAPLYVPGSIPAGRLQAAMARDPESDRFVMFGGKTLDLYFYFGDLWTLSSQGNLATWTRVRSSGGPGPRETVAITDSARGRILVYGGVDNVVWYEDLWSLRIVGDSAQWTPIPTESPRPDGRVGYSVVLDTHRDRLVLFGGHHNTYRSDIWTLSLVGPPYRWQPLNPAPGVGPAPRYGHSAGYDPVLDALVVFGGSDGSSQLLNDAWVLPFADSVYWHPVTIDGPAPAGRVLAGSAWDAQHDRFLVHGGNLIGSAVSDAWALTIGYSPLDAAPASPTLAFAGASPNPARGEVWLSFAMPTAGGARVRLFDAAGRMRGESQGTYAAGSHRVRVDAAAPLAPGLYFAELAANGMRRAARVVVAR